MLAFVDHRRREGAERSVESLVRQAQEQLREGGAPDGDVHSGQELAQRVRERVGGLHLAGERDGDTDQIDLRAAQATREGTEVVAEGIATLAGVARDLFGAQQREGRAVGDEVDRQRMMRGADHALRGVDGGHGVGVGARVVEALSRAVAHHRERAVDGPGHRGSLPPRRPERGVGQLVFVRKRALFFEGRQPLLDAGRELFEARAREQPLPRLDVRVDGQHLDVVRAQPGREGGHGQVGRGGIASRRIDEGDAHVSGPRIARSDEPQRAGVHPSSISIA